LTHDHLDPDSIERYYILGFKEKPVHRRWPRLWNKHYRIRLLDRKFIKLHGQRRRLDFKTLRKLSVKYTPQHLYMSVLNYLMPERVGEKFKANRAYPIGGEYVVDVDLHLFWRPHYHYVGLDGVCTRCLSISKEATLRIVDKISENYSDIHIVFSGKKGFHVHVHDFAVGDWTYYDERDPIKSHEVARYIYTKHIKGATGGFDDSHFKLSCDPMRMITFPESLNAVTGLICTHLGTPSDFARKPVLEILRESRALRYFHEASFQTLSHSHPEPLLRIRR
jgi:hypothetical protein